MKLIEAQAITKSGLASMILIGYLLCFLICFDYICRKQLTSNHIALRAMLGAVIL